MSKDVFKIPVGDGIICPKCGEKNFYYLSKTGKKKGILVGEYEYESLFDPHHGKSYDCYTCGHRWKVRKSKYPLIIRICKKIYAI